MGWGLVNKTMLFERRLNSNIVLRRWNGKRTLEIGNIVDRETHEDENVFMSRKRVRTS